MFAKRKILMKSKVHVLFKRLNVMDEVPWYIATHTIQVISQIGYSFTSECTTFVVTVFPVYVWSTFFFINVWIIDMKMKITEISIPIRKYKRFAW